MEPDPSPVPVAAADADGSQIVLAALELTRGLTIQMTAIGWGS